MKSLPVTAVTFFLSSGIAAQAEPLPQPATDYATKATMAGGMTIQSRYSNGRMRMEMSGPGAPQPMVAYFDLKTRKGMMVMSMPGMPPMGIDISPGDQSGMGVATGSGQRVGADRVAGEACDVWRIDPPAGEKGETVGCITRDGIALRMEATVDGKRQTVFQVTEISRAPQDAKLFTPPANVKPMPMPKGMMPPRR
jgi:hypothetical protein